ncbi:exodeoxyribonuclease VII small subunit [Acidobacteriota bacterium]
MTQKSFEKALAELESIVEKMEAGESSLDESLALFEKGVQLAKFLREELGKAEKKVEILLKNAEGQVTGEPFDLPAEENTDKKPQEGGSGENDSLPF